MTLALSSIFGLSLANAVYHGWKLSLVSLGGIPVVILLSSLVASMKAKEVVEEEAAYVPASALAQEVLLNIRTVMVYGGQKKEFREFTGRVERKKGKVRLRILLFSLATALMWLLVYGTYALSIWYGAPMIYHIWRCSN
jgi:ABC-type multidrug transport system fused ATPase/permease subunit